MHKIISCGGFKKLKPLFKLKEKPIRRLFQHHRRLLKELPEGGLSAQGLSKGTVEIRHGKGGEGIL
jgi:hypothetical protein